MKLAWQAAFVGRYRPETLSARWGRCWWIGRLGLFVYLDQHMMIASRAMDRPMGWFSWGILPPDEPPQRQTAWFVQLWRFEVRWWWCREDVVAERFRPGGVR